MYYRSLPRYKLLTRLLDRCIKHLTTLPVGLYYDERRTSIKSCVLSICPLIIKNNFPFVHVSNHSWKQVCQIQRCTCHFMLMCKIQVCIVYEYWPETTELITWTNGLQHRCYMCIQWTRVLYYVVITWQPNTSILQFNSSPCNEFTSVNVCTQYSQNTHTT